MVNDRTPLGAVIAAVVELPETTRLLCDPAADSDPLRDRLEGRG